MADFDTGGSAEMLVMHGKSPRLGFTLFRIFEASSFFALYRMIHDTPAVYRM